MKDAELGQCSRMTLDESRSSETSVGDRLPDQLGDVDDEVSSSLVGIARRTHLTHTDADDIVETEVTVTVAEVKDGADDLPSPRRVGPAVPMPLKHDRRSIVGLDSGAEIWPERARGTLAPWEVRAAEPTSDQALTAPLSEIQMLLPAALKSDHPALGVREADAVQRLEPQPTPTLLL